MKIEVLLSKVDHTLLSTTATWEDIKALCDEALKYHTASVCVPPCYVKQAHDYLDSIIPVCTVIGFPNGNQTTKVKAYEARDAVYNGADEIDMVINLGMVKSGDFDGIQHEIQTVKSACGTKILKVIIETSELTYDEKIKMCEIVSQAGADYIKTSTGFSKGGATLEDVRLLKANVKNSVKVKAAGGISSIETAETFFSNGADRLGTSRIIKILKSEESKNY